MQDLSNMKSPTFIISLELGLVITCLLSFSCHKKKLLTTNFGRNIEGQISMLGKTRIQQP